MTAKTVFRALLCCIIVIVTLEACARIDDYIIFGAPIFSPYNSETLYQQDSIGKHGKPNARYKKWKLNSLGFRGPEPAPNKTTVVCFGSSETFGLYEAPGEEYPRQLEQEINAQFGNGDFQVVNVAYPGETIPTATRRIPEIVDAMHPKFAFIYPSPATYIWLPWLEQSRKPSKLPPGPLPQPRFEWRIAENLRVILKQLVPEALQARMRAREIRKAANEFPTMQRLPDENIAMFRQDLGDFVKQLRAYGIEPILVTHATYFGNTVSDHDRQMLLAWRKFYPMLKEEGFLDMEARANAAMKQVAAEQNITLVDAASAMPPGNEYFADFVHFTDKGSHTMAVRLAGGLRDAISKHNGSESALSAKNVTAAGRKGR